MYALLFNFPVLFLLALLPAVWAFGWGLIALSRRVGRWPIRLVVGLAGLALAVAILGHVYFAASYLGSPSYTDHIEPNTAIVAWIYSQGGQIYHALDAPERYSFLYGPAPYIATAWVFDLLGGSVFAAKLAGFLCFLASLLLIAASVRRRLPDQWGPVLLALGYFCLLALYFKNHSFWSKPDPFMIVAMAAGLYSCVLQPGRAAWLLCGAALGLAVNAKITGCVYFLPYLVWFLQRDGLRAPLVSLLAAGFVALLPYWSVEQVSLPNYLALLQSAGGHGISKPLLVYNLAFVLFAIAPLVGFLAWQFGSVGIRSWMTRYKMVSAATAVSAALILIAASKPGSGAHHFLPFLPPLAFLIAYSAARVEKYRPVTNWCVYAFWAPALAFVCVAGLKTGYSLYYGLRVVNFQYNSTEMIADLDQVIATYPGKHIHMGYGDGSSYPDTFLRDRLSYAGHPYMLDAPALMDFQYSGLTIPESTLDAMRADADAMWLIPAGQEPFTMVNWYYRSQGTKLFGDEFRRAFGESFRLQGSSGFYDLYVPVVQ